MSDRKCLSLMAWLFVAVAIVGFAPRSLAIVGGAMQSPPLVVHLHAAVMSAFSVLLALQASASFTGRWKLHRRLGKPTLYVAMAVFACWSP